MTPSIPPVLLLAHVERRRVKEKWLHFALIIVSRNCAECNSFV
jgi:hypothetical protein